MGREEWKVRMKGIEIAASLAIVLSLLCLLPASASAQAVVAIENASALPNETTTTNVIAYNVTNLGNFGITVTYDPSVVNVTDISGGPGVGTFGWDRISDGKVRFYTVNTLEIPSLSGDVTLATLTLKAVGAAGSESPLNLEIGKLLDNKSNPIPAIPKNGTVIVSVLRRIGDINGDDEVTFDDVIALAKHIYFRAPVYDDPDVNGDDEVTFDDVILLAKHIYFGTPIYP